MRRSATALSLSDSDQSGVAAISVVVTFVAVELPSRIALVPKQSLIEIFAPDGPDQSLDKSMRVGVEGMDLISSISRIRTSFLDSILIRPRESNSVRIPASCPMVVSSVSPSIWSCSKASARAW